MKLVMAIINNDDSNRVQKALANNGFFATKLATTGGFLMSGNTTLIVGAEDEKINKIMEILKKNSKKRMEHIDTSVNLAGGMFSMPSTTEVLIGGATVFVLNVERFEKI